MCVFRDSVAEKQLEKMHLQDLLQRIEMDVATKDPKEG
jgi:hypothetical protein